MVTITPAIEDHVEVLPEDDSSSDWDDEVAPLNSDLIRCSDKELKQSAIFCGFFNLTKAFLGAAGFALPYALSQGGLIAGLLSMIVFAFAAAHTLKLLQRCRMIVTHPSWRHGQPMVNPTYVDIGAAAFGKRGRVAVIFGIIAMSLGVCSAYLVFIGKTLHSVFDRFGFTPVLPGMPSQMPALLMSLPLAILISLLGGWDTFLTCSSACGLLMITSAMVIVSIYAFTNGEGRDWSGFSPGAPLYIDAEHYPVFFGNAAFLFCIHTVAIPVAQSIEKIVNDKLSENKNIRVQINSDEDNKASEKEPLLTTPATPSLSRRGSFASLTPGACARLSVTHIEDGDNQPSTVCVAKMYFKAVNYSVALVCVSNMFFAGICYTAFKDITQESVIDNWVTTCSSPMCKTGFVTAVQLLLIADIVTTYALFLQPITQLLEELLWPAEPSQLMRSTFIKLNIVVLTSVLSLTIPHFALASGLVGAVANTLLGLILPPMLFLKLRGTLPVTLTNSYESEASLDWVKQNRITTRQMIVNVSISILGVVLMFLSGTMTLVKIIQLR
eukprot:TRINITY_DN10485_c0_g1_i1.p1 TRINITY_DN10485_c0_g1~~TRINITY_DN10485_c0_g1_i1.p1  ORF type:complete len:578 (+),score=83.21 TRINITY_DN10485_c0_g1_i1:73-1734(+)